VILVDPKQVKTELSQHIEIDYVPRRYGGNGNDWYEEVGWEEFTTEISLPLQRPSQNCYTEDSFVTNAIQTTSNCKEMEIPNSFNANLYDDRFLTNLTPPMPSTSTTPETLNNETDEFFGNILLDTIENPNTEVRDSFDDEHNEQSDPDLQIDENEIDDSKETRTQDMFSHSYVSLTNLETPPQEINLRISNLKTSRRRVTSAKGKEPEFPVYFEEVTIQPKENTRTSIQELLEPPAIQTYGFEEPRQPQKTTIIYQLPQTSKPRRVWNWRLLRWISMVDESTQTIVHTSTQTDPNDFFTAGPDDVFITPRDRQYINKYHRANPLNEFSEQNLQKSQFLDRSSSINQEVSHKESLHRVGEKQSFLEKMKHFGKYVRKHRT
ncbi:hypothetical protein HK096_000486, partial [Nowakowskiella sp. JEL0078]